VTREIFYTLLAAAVLALCVVPIGSAAFILGFWHGDSPCVLCWAQRTGMILVALMGLFVLRYGARPRYLGLSVLIAAWGVYMAIRHSAAHVVRDVGQGFSIEILGAHTYIWSGFIYWACLVAMGGLLMLLRDGETGRTPRRLRTIDTLAMWTFLLVAAGNVVQAFASTGPPPYMGQADPVRFSFDPRRWVWSLEEWSPAPVSLRGRWAIEKPSVQGLPADPGRGPLGALPVLTVARRLTIRVPLDGAITDLAYHAGSDRFLVTTAQGVYITDGTLGRVLRHTVVDPGFSVDLGDLAGAAFLDERTVMALSQNKSFVILRESGQPDVARNFRFFLQSFDAFDEVTRSRFATVRARMMYVMSLAHAPDSGSLVTVSVPNRRVRQLVVSRFARRDLMLSEEFVPRLAPGSGLALGSGERSLAELAVTGAAVAGTRLYAMSAAYATLLTIDLTTREVVAAHAVPGVTGATGLALKNGELWIPDERGGVSIVARP
jgi:disulfide bond formation protein DsbB